MSAARMHAVPARALLRRLGAACVRVGTSPFSEH
ncbi:hypothetical protein GGR71_002770 [Xanthomonas sp. F1]